MVSAYRIVSPKFSNNAFDGEGARLYGGRWNSKGIRAVYTSASPSLAALEAFVHLGIDAKAFPHLIFTIQIPNEIIIKAKNIPSSWRDNPAPQACIDFGTRWLRSLKSAVLEVPSAIMELESNFVLNPMHEDFKKIVISEPVSYRFDDRMWKIG